MNVLHLSFNEVYNFELKSIFKNLDFNYEFQKINDIDNRKYNLTAERAIEYWKKYKNIFKEFDIIVITDTSPLVRIILEKYEGIIILWINNRIDYHDSGNLKFNEIFPDNDYYNKLNTNKIDFFSMSLFDKYYLMKIKNFNQKINLLYPIGYNNFDYYFISDEEIYNFYFNSNHNENEINLEKILQELSINFQTEYKIGLRGIIHIPFEWNSFDFFKKIKNNDIFFIPSIEFLKTLSNENNLYWQEPFNFNNIEKSCWYDIYFKDCFVYFNSWKDLKLKTLTTKFKNKKNIINNFFKFHEKNSLEIWSNFLKKKVIFSNVG